MASQLPVGALALTSLLLTGAVVGNAYYQKKQFYPSVVYITKSNSSMAAIYFLAFTLVILFGQLLKKVFFGQLRAAEFEHLIERSFYAVTETCLAFTVFRDDFSPKFVALFTVLLFLKAFHWLADSRVDYMERSPVITLLFHLRVTSLLFLLGLFDVLLVSHAYHSTMARGASVQLAFGFEYAILLTIALNIGVKYVCHAIDLQSEDPWENKAVYLLYTELLVGLAKVILYALFTFIMIRIHTFPLFIIRPMYFAVSSFKKAFNDVIQSRRAINNMNTLYPNATPEELSAVDNVCIICREEMTTGAKKLPCGHIFHTSCLRSWFQRQQTCPTCRMDILRQTIPTATTTPPPQPAGNQQAAQQPAPTVTPATSQPSGTNPQAGGQRQPPNPANMFPFNGMAPPPFAFPGMTMFPQRPNTNAAGTSSTSTSDSTTTSTEGASGGQEMPRPPQPPFNLVPPFFPMMPFNLPFPVAPPNFSGFTIEELRQMEGRERSNVEARIEALRNIQTLLDASVIQMNQYASIIAALDKESGAIPKTSRAESKSQNSTTNSSSDQATNSTASSQSHSSPIKNVSVNNSKASTSSAINQNNDIPLAEASAEASATAVESDEAGELRRRRLEKFSRDPPT